MLQCCKFFWKIPFTVFMIVGVASRMSFSQLLCATHRCQRVNSTLKVGKRWISLLSMELCCMAYIVSSVVQPTCTVVFLKEFTCSEHA